MILTREISTGALALVLGTLLLATPALALDGFDDVAGDVCNASPSDAPGEIEDAYANRDTGDMDASACKKLCQSVRKACDDRAKNIADCIADQNKRQAKVEDESCDDKDCAKDVKKAKKDDDKAAKSDAKDTKQGCKDLESDCVDTCEEGTLFPQE